MKRLYLTNPDPQDWNHGHLDKFIDTMRASFPHLKAVEVVGAAIYDLIRHSSSDREFYSEVDDV
jgi:hypothetical protein